MSPVPNWMQDDQEVDPTPDWMKNDQAEGQLAPQTQIPNVSKLDLSFLRDIPVPEAEVPSPSELSQEELTSAQLRQAWDKQVAKDNRETSLRNNWKKINAQATEPGTPEYDFAVEAYKTLNEGQEPHPDYIGPPLTLDEQRRLLDIEPKPFLGEIYEVYKAVILASAARRLESNEGVDYKGREDDEQLVVDYFHQKEILGNRGTTLKSDIFLGAMALVPYVTTFALSGPLAGGVKAIGKRTGKKLLMKLGEKGLKSKLAQAGVKLGSGIAQTVARSPVFAPYVALDALQDQAPLAYDYTDEGRMIIEESPNSPAKSVMKAYAKTLVMIGIEQFGGRITDKALGKLGVFAKGALAKISKKTISKKMPKGVALFKGLKGLWMRATKGTSDEFTKKLLEPMGIQSLIGELSEEAMEKMVLSVTGLESFGDGDNDTILQRVSDGLIGGRELLVATAVLSIPALGRFAVGRITAKSRAARANRGQKTAVNRLLGPNAGASTTGPTTRPGATLGQEQSRSIVTTPSGPEVTTGNTKPSKAKGKTSSEMTAKEMMSKQARLSIETRRAYEDLADAIGINLTETKTGLMPGDVVEEARKLNQHPQEFEDLDNALQASREWRAIVEKEIPKRGVPDWRLTKKQFELNLLQDRELVETIQEIKDIAAKDRGEVGKLGVPRGKAKSHKQLVKEALTQGKKVPLKVLVDYPDLQQSEISRQTKLKEAKVTSSKYDRKRRHIAPVPGLRGLEKTVPAETLNQYTERLRLEALRIAELIESGVDSPQLRTDLDDIKARLRKIVNAGGGKGLISYTFLDETEASTKPTSTLGLANFLRSESANRRAKGLRSAIAYDKAAKTLADLKGPLPTTLKGFLAIKGIGPKIGKTLFAFTKASESERLALLTSSEQSSRIPAAPKVKKQQPSGSNEPLGQQGFESSKGSAGEDYNNYQKSLITRASERGDGKVRYNVGTYFRPDFVDRGAKIETSSGNKVYEHAHAVELGRNMDTYTRSKIQERLLETGINVHKMSLEQKNLTISYMTSGKVPEGLLPKFKEYADILRDFDNAPIAGTQNSLKDMVKKLRVDKYSIQGDNQGLTKAQVKLISHFRPLYRADPTEYYKAVDVFAKTPESNILVKENYFTRRAVGLTNIEGVADLRTIKKQPLGATYPKSLQARLSKKAYVDVSENPLLDQLQHNMAIVRSFYLTQPVRNYYNVLKGNLSELDLSREVNVLRVMLGKNQRGSIATELRAVGSNIFKTFVSAGSVIVKNFFQRFQGQAFRKGINSLKLKVHVNEKAFINDWKSLVPDIKVKLESTVFQGRPIYRNLFNLGLERENWKNIGKTALAIRVVGNNPIIRGMNKLWADKAARIHVDIFDKDNRLVTMNSVMSDAKKALIDQKLPWAQAKKYLSFSSLNKPAQAYLTKLYAQAERGEIPIGEAIFQNARLVTNATQFRYDTPLRDLLSNTTVGWPMMQFSVWWRSFGNLYERTVLDSYNSKTLEGFKGGAKLLGLSIVGGVAYKAVVGALAPGRDWEEVLWNSVKETVNPFGRENIGGPSTLLAPVNVIVQLAREGTPSAILAQAKSFILGAVTAGRLLGQLYESGGYDEKEIEKAKRSAKVLADLTHEQLSSFYWGYRRISKTLDALGDTRNANVLRKGLKKIVGIDYKPQKQERSTSEFISTVLFLKNPRPSRRQKLIGIIAAGEKDLNDRTEFKRIKTLISLGLTLDETIELIREFKKELSETTNKRRWTNREANRIRSRIRNRWQQFDKARQKGQIEEDQVPTESWVEELMR